MRAERGLAGAAGPGEQVGLALATAGDGVAQRPHDVVLALQLAEPARPVAAVERRGGHAAEPTEGVSAATGGPTPPVAAGGPGRAANYRVPVVPTRTGVPGRTLRLLVAASLAARRRRCVLARRLGPAGAQAQTSLESPTRPTAPSSTTPPTQIVLTFDEPIGDADRSTVACNGDPFDRPTAGRPSASDDGADADRRRSSSRCRPATCNVSWTVSAADRRGRRRRPLQLHGARLVDAAGRRRPPTAPPATGDHGAGDDRRTDVDGSDDERRSTPSDVSDGATWLGRVLSTFGLAVLFGSLVLIVAAWPEGPEYILAVRFLRSVWMLDARRHAALRRRAQRGGQRRVVRQRPQPGGVARPARRRLGRPGRDRPARARGRRRAGSCCARSG